MTDPVRTCVACRTRRPQRALLRLRRRSDGIVIPAMGTRTHGRSAYLCPNRGCLQTALRRRALERSLGRSPRTDRRQQPEERSGRAARVRAPMLETLWGQLHAALDLEIQTLQRSGDTSRSLRFDALVRLHQELREPGRSA